MVPLLEDSDKAPVAVCPGDITLLLHRCSNEPQALAELFSRLYPELRRLAATRMRAERRDHTWQPTELLNEFFLRMARQTDLSWKSRAHFFAVASRAMRNLLVDYARRRDCQKGPGGVQFVELSDFATPPGSTPITVLEFVDVLDRLEAQEPRMARVAEMRCFGGLTHQEIADALGVDERTVKRDWDFAGSWLRSQLRKDRGNAAR